MSFKAKFLLFITILLWASAFVGIRGALDGYSPEGLALLRYLIASVCLGIFYFRLPNKTLSNFYDIVKLLIFGVLGIAVYNIALNYGELSVSSGMASFIISQSPIITALFAILFLGEVLNFPRAIGFIVSMFGVFLIALGEGGFIWDVNILYIMIATLISGAYSVLQKPFLIKYNALEVTTYIIWGGTIALLFYLPQLQHDLSIASFKATCTVIYLGIFPAAIGYVAWSYVLSEMPASRAASFTYLMPFVATVLGWIYLGEVPITLSIIGALLAIIGTWFVNQSFATLKPTFKAAID